MYLLCLEPEETFYSITDIQEKKITWLINNKKMPRVFRLSTNGETKEIVSDTILGYTKTDFSQLLQTSPQIPHQGQQLRLE